MKNKNNSDIRPCIYTDKDGEHSVGFHCFNGNRAIVEFANGSVREVPIENIELLDSEFKLGEFERINSAECLKRYWGNEKCFKDRYEYLKKERPDLFEEK